MSPRRVDIPMEPADLELQSRLKAFLDLIDQAVQWAIKYGKYDKADFAAPVVRNIRRNAERAYRASKRRLCVGLFGPSQAGKSFLISELGRGEGTTLMIARSGDHNEPVPFLERINPDRRDEATAVVCRLTRFPQVVPERPGTFVARMLSPADILKCLATGFACECNFPKVSDLAKRLDEIFQTIPEGKGDDPFIETLSDAWAYVQETFGREHAYFGTLLEEGNIEDRLSRTGGPLTEAQRLRLASTLWGMGTMPAIDMLYKHLRSGLAKFGEVEHVEIDQGAIVLSREHGAAEAEMRTICDSTILADLMKGRYGRTRVYTGNGSSGPIDVEKATASALVAELCFPVAREGQKQDSQVVERADVLDFPGARAGRAGQSGLNAEDLRDDETGRKNVVEMFKRGKLTYLFEGYCREREISALTFCADPTENQECHHAAAQIARWIDTRYPRFGALDAEELEHPSLFLTLTKFDKLLKPIVWVGTDVLWDSVIDKFVRFFRMSQATEDSWFTNWGREAGNPFDNLYWVRNPMFGVDLDPVAKYRDAYRGSKNVRQFVRDWEARWQAVEPQTRDDREHTGIALLAQSIIRKLRPETKRVELANQLHAMCKELERFLAGYFVSVHADERTQAAKEAARQLLKAMHEHEKDCVFGMLLATLGLPSHIVQHELEKMTAGVVPVLTEHQITSFVEALREKWHQHVRDCLESEGLGRLMSEDPTLLGRFASELAHRAAASNFHVDMSDSVRFFFEHALGLDHFRQPLTAICCRKWSDFVTTFGYPLERPSDPPLPPKLTRNVPWRRYLSHWDKHVEQLYVENCSGPREIPPGNDVLGGILDGLRAILAGLDQKPSAAPSSWQTPGQAREFGSVQ